MLSFSHILCCIADHVVRCTQLHSSRPTPAESDSCRSQAVPYKVDSDEREELPAAQGDRRSVRRWPRCPGVDGCYQRSEGIRVYRRNSYFHGIHNSSLARGNSPVFPGCILCNSPCCRLRRNLATNCSFYRQDHVGQVSANEYRGVQCCGKARSRSPS